MGKEIKALQIYIHFPNMATAGKWNGERDKKQKGNIDNLTPFTSDRQPSPEAKRAWRQRKKEAQRMMETLMWFQEMNAEQIKAYIDKHKDEMPVKDLVMLQYLEDILKNPKIRIDWINRHVPYAPQKQELEHKGSIIIEQVNYGKLPKNKNSS